MKRCHKCGDIGCSLSEHARGAKQLPVWYVVPIRNEREWRGPLSWRRARSLAAEIEQRGTPVRIQRRSSAIHDRRAA